MENASCKIGKDFKGKVIFNKMEQEFTRYEKARILGARALQIAMNAPILVKISKDDLERIRYDAIKIAEIEFESGVLPISISRPMPKRKDEKLKRIREITDDKKIEEKEAEEAFAAASRIKEFALKKTNSKKERKTTTKSFDLSSR